MQHLVAKICTVFYSIGKSYSFGFGQAKFPEKWVEVVWPGGDVVGRDGCAAVESAWVKCSR